MSNAIEKMFDGAPDCATHARDYKHGVDFYKRENGSWLYYEKGSWKVSFGTSEKDCVERPQPKPWSGPEDGLPPIDLEVLFKVKGRHQGFGYVSFYGEEFCVIRNTTPDGGPTEQVCMIDEFSAIQTRSAYEATTARETAIRELMDIAQVDCRVTAARLVDAGFKREVV